MVKKLTVIISFAAFNFFSVALVYAQDVPVGIADRVANFYNVALGAGVILALGVLVYSGVRYTVSAGSPSGQKEARAWILGGVLGLLILFSSVIILQTINPSLTELEDPLLARQTQPPVITTDAGGIDLFEWLTNFMDDIFSIEDESTGFEPGPIDPVVTGTFWCSYNFGTSSCEVASSNQCTIGFVPRPADCSKLESTAACNNIVVNRFQCVRLPTCIDECIAFGAISPELCENFEPCPRDYEAFAALARSFAVPADSADESPKALNGNARIAALPTNPNTLAYIAAEPTRNKSAPYPRCYGADCGTYVASVVRNTIDPDWPVIGTCNIKSYINSDAGRAKFDVISNSPFSTANLRPGDILFSKCNGHVSIWLDDGEYEASFSRTGGTCTRGSLPNGPDARPGSNLTTIIRYKGF